MILRENPELKRELARRAWKGNRIGRLGFVAAVALVAAAPVVGLLVRGLLESAWAGTNEYHGRLVFFVDLVTITLMLFLAYTVRKRTWEQCNREIGMRCAQEARIEDGYLTYAYRAKGVGTNVVMVDLSDDASSMSMDPQTGIITLLGAVRGQTFKTVDKGSLVTIFDQMVPLESIRIPNCFDPNLYQALLAFYR